MKYATISAKAVSISGWVMTDETTAADQVRNFSRSDTGTPSSSLITVTGSGNANACSKSISPAPIAASSSSSVAGDLLDPGPQVSYPPCGERIGDQPSQPGVVGRVEAEQVRGKGALRPVLLRAFRHHRVPVVGQPLVGQRGAHVWVPGDQPGLIAIRHLRQRDRLVSAQPAVQMMRILEIPRVELDNVAHITELK